MQFGLVAVKADVKRLVDAVATLWPHAKVEASATLPGLAALGPWMQASLSEIMAKAQPPGSVGMEVVAFWQNGAWSVMLDPTFSRAADETALASLSESFGLTLSFIVESSSSCAFFTAFEAGHLRRAIRSTVGEVSTEGEPMPQEPSPPDADYYLNGTDPLMRAFGIRPLASLPADTAIQAVAFSTRAGH